MSKLIVIPTERAVADITSLILPDGTLALSREAVQRKFDLLAESTATTTEPFTNAAARDHAIQVAARLKGEEDDAEDDREKAKSLFWRMCGAIDLTKKKHVAELTTERTRLNRQVGAYNAEQQLKAQREQEARDRETRRIQQEAAEAQRKAEAEAERLRKEQEALALKQKQAQEAAEAKGREQTPAAKAKALQAQLDQEEAAEKAEAIRLEQQASSDRALRQLESERLAAAERQRSEKPSGGAQRTEPKITVTDIHALYAYQRNLVRMEPDLVNLKFLIRGNPTISIPGVSFVMESTFSAKAR